MSACTAAPNNVCTHLPRLRLAYGEVLVINTLYECEKEGMCGWRGRRRTWSAVISSCCRSSTWGSMVEIGGEWVSLLEEGRAQWTSAAQACIARVCAVKRCRGGGREGQRTNRVIRTQLPPQRLASRLDMRGSLRHVRSPSAAAFLATTFPLSVLPPPLLISSLRSTLHAPAAFVSLRTHRWTGSLLCHRIALSSAIVVLHDDALFGNNPREYTRFRLVM